MSMTTELIDRLKQHATELHNNLIIINERIENQCVKDMREAAEVIEELSLKLHNSQMERSCQFYHGGWIPVSERLPEYDENIFVCDIDGDIYFTHKSHLTNKYYDSFGNDIKNVLAWMPLPEPYIESEVNENE